ncbi:hypothetical protein [Dyadobacter sandarakinus]|uniref:Uncharacterized protein n=1 Tax=Dyadobacter sandarakinus TaxID=2747268 RepID=A0ABX7IAK9_9BACT|nr:hypothetical protein [Dyadobacter sandarakinus]QRR03154.1 hypothetical protein HWI92_20665 [Dyadobacter sandarakinus]
MKTHPVDDLFRSKLSDISKTPSNAAWEKLSAGTGKENKSKAHWWYGVAASLAMLVSIGYVVWNVEHEQRTGTHISLAQKQPQANDPKPTEVPTDLPEAKSAVEVRPETSMTAVVAAGTDKKRHVQELSAPQPNIQESSIQKREELVTAVTPLESIAPIEINEKEQSMPKLPELAEQSVATATQEEVNRKMVVHIELPSEDGRKAKESRFVKVFRQLKNARAGEKVDWEEVGFNPKRIIARVDDKLRNGEEKFSDKYQDIKEKTKL